MLRLSGTQKREPEGKMENYIVRIYRTDKKSSRNLIGLVEEVGVEGQRAFRNLEELWAILNPSKGRKSTRKRVEKGWSGSLVYKERGRG